MNNHQPRINFCGVVSSLRFCMGGFLVALTSFLTTYATSKKQALQHGYHIDASQDGAAAAPLRSTGTRGPNAGDSNFYRKK